jgi:uncharacterized membrane protein
MNIPESAQPERKEKSSRETGTKIVISGALASIALWLIVLATGDPIRPFKSTSMSFAYALAICAPAMVLSILAIWRTGKRNE